MANIFEKFYEKLNLLQEDFNTNAEIEAFFDDFLVAYVATFNNAITKSQWMVINVPHNVVVQNLGTDKQIATTASIQVQTRATASYAAFDADLDFDQTAPIRHKGWEEYHFKKDHSQIIRTMSEYLMHFASKGIDLSSIDNRFPKVKVVVSNITYQEVPYAYKYDSNNKVAVSNFARDLKATFELTLSYLDQKIASTKRAPTPVLAVEIHAPALSANKPSNGKGMLFDEDYNYEVNDLTAEYKKAASKYDTSSEVIKALGLKEPDYLYDSICEIKIGAFQYEDPTLYPAGPSCTDPHFVTWELKEPFYVTTQLKSALTPILYWDKFGAVPRISSDIVLEHVESFIVYIKDKSNDVADLINKFADRIIAELPNPKTAFLPTTFTPTEKKLHEFLADVSWKAKFDSGIAMEGTGYEIYNNFRTKLIGDKQKVTKFIIISGEF